MPHRAPCAVSDLAGWWSQQGSCQGTPTWPRWCTRASPPSCRFGARTTGSSRQCCLRRHCQPRDERSRVGPGVADRRWARRPARSDQRRAADDREHAARCPAPAGLLQADQGQQSRPGGLDVPGPPGQTVSGRRRRRGVWQVTASRSAPPFRCAAAWTRNLCGCARWFQRRVHGWMTGPEGRPRRNLMDWSRSAWRGCESRPATLPPSTPTAPHVVPRRSGSVARFRQDRSRWSLLERSAADRGCVRRMSRERSSRDGGDGRFPTAWKSGSFQVRRAGSRRSGATSPSRHGLSRPLHPHPTTGGSAAAPAPRMAPRRSRRCA